MVVEPNIDIMVAGDLRTLDEDDGPEDFYALSKFYLHFEQVDDAQVLEILRSHNPAPRKQ